MFARALIAFLALPGLVAFAVPIAWLRLDPDAAFGRPLGLLPLVAGTLGLLWCVRDFTVSGQGTLAPWAPPRRLVVVGLYRYTRNPMYIAVTLILLGWSVAFALRGLCIYTIIVAVAFHWRVMRGEEPWLARTYGSQWREYAARVPRWFRWPRR